MPCRRVALHSRRSRWARDEFEKFIEDRVQEEKEKRTEGTHGEYLPVQRIAHLEGGGMAGLRVAGEQQGSTQSWQARTVLILSKPWASLLGSLCSLPLEAAANYCLNAIEIGGKYARYCEWTRRVKFLYVTIHQKTELMSSWSRVKTWRNEKLRDGANLGGIEGSQQTNFNQGQREVVLEPLVFQMRLLMILFRFVSPTWPMLTVGLFSPTPMRPHRSDSTFWMFGFAQCRPGIPPCTGDSTSATGDKSKSAQTADKQGGGDKVGVGDCVGKGNKGGRTSNVGKGSKGVKRVRSDDSGPSDDDDDDEVGQPGLLRPPKNLKKIVTEEVKAARKKAASASTAIN